VQFLFPFLSVIPMKVFSVVFSLKNPSSSNRRQSSTNSTARGSNQQLHEHTESIKQQGDIDELPLEWKGPEIRSLPDVYGKEKQIFLTN
jgi:hypothetical protein